MPVLSYSSNTATLSYLSRPARQASLFCLKQLWLLCGRHGYERELHGVLVQLVKEMDRKIEKQKERANKEGEPRKLAEKEREQLEAIKVSSQLLCAWPAAFSDVCDM